MDRLLEGQLSRCDSSTANKDVAARLSKWRSQDGAFARIEAWLEESREWAAFCRAAQAGRAYGRQFSPRANECDNFCAHCRLACDIAYRDPLTKEPLQNNGIEVLAPQLLSSGQSVGPSASPIQTKMFPR